MHTKMEQLDVCNSWEEFDDDSKLLEQQLEKLQLQKGRTSESSGTEQQSSSPHEISTSKVPEEIPKMRVLKRTDPLRKAEVTNEGVSPAVSTNTNGVSNGVVIQDESLRTQYVPPEPRISILSRPKKKTSETSSSVNQSKVKNQPLKTLEQREQEYAEARKRIFGDAKVET